MASNDIPVGYQRVYRAPTGRAPKLTSQIRSLKPTDLAVCTVVKAELLFGALKSARRSENLASVRRFLEPFECYPFDDLACDTYAELRVHLERAGTPIGPNDLLIAAIALARDCAVVTANIREFERVPGLRVELWG